MGIPNKKFFTPEEYLELEDVALDKHEYFEGEIFAMSGASIPHNVIFTNTFGELISKLKGKPCMPFGSDLRINIPINTLYTYPDMSIICGDIEKTNDKFDTVKNPTVIFEILSKSTKDYDLGKKFFLYRQIESLKEYIMIDSESMNVLKYLKNEDNSWLLTEMKSMDNVLKINSVNIEIPLSDIYDNVKF